MDWIFANFQMENEYGISEMEGHEITTEINDTPTNFVNKICDVTELNGS